MKAKYKPGGPITSLDELAAQDFICCQHKIYHKGWFQGWQIRSAQHELQRGVRKAVRLTNREYYGEGNLDMLHMQHSSEVCECCPKKSEGATIHGSVLECLALDCCEEAFENWLESKVK